MVFSLVSITVSLISSRGCFHHLTSCCNMPHLSARSIEAQDLQHEEEILRNPYNLKAWWNFLTYKKEASHVTRYVIYERSLKFLPRSYKLWHAYLQERSATLSNKCITDKGYFILENTFERALVNMYKMPRIWFVLGAFSSLMNPSAHHRQPISSLSDSHKIQLTI